MPITLSPAERSAQILEDIAASLQRLELSPEASAEQRDLLTTSKQNIASHCQCARACLHDSRLDDATRHLRDAREQVISLHALIQTDALQDSIALVRICLTLMTKQTDMSH